MRLKTGIFLMLAVFTEANGHTLGGDESIAYELGHQLLGAHHLPLTALLVIGGVVLFRRFKKTRDHGENGIR